MRGELFTSYSADKIIDQQDADNYASEYLNTINLSNLPPHELKLKIGASVILAHRQDCATEPAYVSPALVKESLNVKSLPVNMQAIWFSFHVFPWHPLSALTYLSIFNELIPSAVSLCYDYQQSTRSDA